MLYIFSDWCHRLYFLVVVVLLIVAYSKKERNASTKQQQQRKHSILNVRESAGRAGGRSGSAVPIDDMRYRKRRKGEDVAIITALARSPLTSSKPRMYVGCCCCFTLLLRFLVVIIIQRLVGVVSD